MPSNWAQLQKKLGGGAPKKPKSAAPSAASSGAAAGSGAASSSARLNAPAPATPDAPLSVPAALTTRLALDCEMVGVGSSGSRSALARIVIVGFDERIVYSAFIRPPEPVTDFRTAVSGVRPDHMRHARTFRQAQDEVTAVLKGRTVIGHALSNDFKALMLTHPKADVRDTAAYPAFRRQLGIGTRPRRLKALASELLGWEIQGGTHDPAEDAVAALRLYKLKMSEWERGIASGVRGSTVESSNYEKALAKGKGRSGIKKKRKLKRGTG